MSQVQKKKKKRFFEKKVRDRQRYICSNLEPSSSSDNDNENITPNYLDDNSNDHINQQQGLEIDDYVNDGCCIDNYDTNVSVHYENLSSNSSSGIDFEQENLIKSEKKINDLIQWVRKHNPSEESIKDILVIFGEDYHLPKDPRTLLKYGSETIFTDKISVIGNCSYLHFGIKKWLDKLFCKSSLPEKLKIYINIDGLPLFKSNNMGFWPILGQVKPYHPFIIGLSYGDSKPPVNVYLKPLIEEINSIINNGYLCHGKVTFLCSNDVTFICDAPARSFIKQIKSHTGYYGCDVCEIEGKRVNHRTLFKDLHCPLRTDEKFTNNTYDDTHCFAGLISPLTEIANFSLVRQVPRDPMHLVYLGVVKRVVTYWLKPLESKVVKLSTQQISQISAKIVDISSILPREFVRRPRSLKYFERWKATELRMFLLYIGPIILRDILQQDVYNHFLLLCYAVRILSVKFDNNQLEKADELLRAFITSSEQLYGESFIIYNVHCLAHLALDCKQHGLLESFSAFDFENFLQRIKRCVKNAKSPLETVRRKANIGYFDNYLRDLRYPNDHYEQDWDTVKYIKLLNCYLAPGMRNGVCLTSMQEVIKITRFEKYGSNINIYAVKGIQVIALSTYPFNSLLLNMCIVKGFRSIEEKFSPNDLKSKCVALPCKENNNFYVVPLVHTMQ